MEPEGAGAYDTSAAFEAVLAHLGDHEHLDLMVVTGDVADHGRAAQYEVAADAFARLSVPVNLCPGNHDFDEPFAGGFPHSNLDVERTLVLGDWTFLFADSNSGQMRVDEEGNRSDLPGETRLHSNGSLGTHEAAWIREASAAATTEHVFVWIHHPPGVTVPLIADADYTSEWTALIGDLPNVRGFGGGHTHLPAEFVFADLPVFVSPSFKNNFDLDAKTWLPPGYRTYEFSADGGITSEVHLVDDERWPRHPLGRAILGLFNGELTYDDLAAIAQRRRDQTS